MRYLLSFFLSLTVAIILLFLSPSKALAIPSLRVDPANPIAFDATVKIMIGNCPTGYRIDLDIRNHTYDLFVDRFTLMPAADGTATFSRPDGFREGDYNVWIYCGPNQQETLVTGFRVDKLDPSKITFSTNPPSPFRPSTTASLIADGCPKRSKVTFLWIGDWFAANPEWAGVVSDGTGKAIYTRTQGFWAGNYKASVNCGGTQINDLPFVVFGENPTPTPLPEPPAPVCANDINTDGKCTQVNTALGVINTDGVGIVFSLFVFVLSISGGIALLIIIYAGYLLIMSRGNPEQLQKGREYLTSALIGFLFIIFSIVILEVITVDVLNLPGFRYEGGDGGGKKK